ncbi:MAG: hypothetical protein AAF525_22450, partial [Pseudomonadota bacterium]
MRVHRFTRLWAVSLTTLLGACSVEVDYDGPTHEWPQFGNSVGGGHFSPATQINKDNVHALEQAWIYSSPDFRDAGEVKVQIVGRKLAKAGKKKGFLTDAKPLRGRELRA